MTFQKQYIQHSPSCCNYSCIVTEHKRWTTPDESEKSFIPPLKYHLPDVTYPRIKSKITHLGYTHESKHFGVTSLKGRPIAPTFSGTLHSSERNPWFPIVPVLGF